MKNFLLGALVFAFFSFTAVKTELLTVKPATPKSTVVVVVPYPGNVSSKIKPYLKQGYIVKTMTNTGVIFLEKY